VKNKRNIYFLVLAVLIVWGLIGYKIYDAIKPNELIINATDELTDFKPEELKIQDTFSIQPIYRDPFLGKTFIKKRPFAKKISNAQLMEEDSFPLIQFNGIIAPKQKGRETLYLVVINKNQYFFSIGQQIDGVKLLKGTTKKITLRYKKTKKEFFINQ